MTSLEKRIQKKLARAQAAKERKVRKAERQQQQAAAAAAARVKGTASRQAEHMDVDVDTPLDLDSAPDITASLALQPEPADARRAPPPSNDDDEREEEEEEEEYDELEVGGELQAEDEAQVAEEAAELMRQLQRGGAGGGAARDDDVSSVSDDGGDEGQIASERRAKRARIAGGPMVVSREVLQLSLVEAFFLKHALDTLDIVDDDGRSLSMAECWRLFRRTSATFVQDYITYLSLRSRGWVPKTGLKFAVDFVAYRQGPPFYHSSFSVLVRTAWEDVLQPWDAGDAARPLNWSFLFNISRMANQV